MNKVSTVLMAAVLVCAAPQFALSHEGAHGAGEDHSMESSRKDFKEGSGSSVLEEAGHEYKEQNHNRKTGTGSMEEGSGGMIPPYDEGNDPRYKGESAESPQNLKTKTHRMREGS